MTTNNYNILITIGTVTRRPFLIPLATQQLGCNITMCLTACSSCSIIHPLVSRCLCLIYNPPISLGGILHFTTLLLHLLARANLLSLAIHFFTALLLGHPHSPNHSKPDLQASVYVGGVMGRVDKGNPIVQTFIPGRYQKSVEEFLPATKTKIPVKVVSVVEQTMEIRGGWYSKGSTLWIVIFM